MTSDVVAVARAAIDRPEVAVDPAAMESKVVATAYLHAAKADFLARPGEAASAASHLTEACAWLSPAPPSPLRRETKRLIRSVTARVAGTTDQPIDVAALPQWCRVRIGDEVVALLNEWQQVGAESAEGGWVRDHVDDIAAVFDSGELDAMSAHFDGDSFVERCEQIAAAIAADGIERVTDWLARTGAQTDLLRRWTQTRSWIESEQFYLSHKAELDQIDPEVTDQLDDQHGAILRLCRVRPVDESFELVRSPAQAAVAALDAMAVGDDELLRTILRASPGVSNQAGAGPVALAAAIIASGRVDLPDEVVAMVRATSSPAIRPLLRSRLQALKAARPERADVVARLLVALED